MIQKYFTFKSDEGTEIYVYKWIPDENTGVKGVVQLVHGMAETAIRYERFAKKLTGNVYIVYINDHRGHGKTAKTVETLGILAEKDGSKWLVEVVHKLTGIIKNENPNLPVFLLGDSMVSFITQRYIMLYWEELKGAILSGPNGKQGIILNIALHIAKSEIKKHGRNTISKKLDKMSFGKYNNAFKPNRTEFDWLNRDNAEVDKYVNDPFCGTVFTNGFFYDFLNGLTKIENKENLNGVPKDLPIYIFSGA